MSDLDEDGYSGTMFDLDQVVFLSKFRMAVDLGGIYSPTHLDKTKSSVIH